MTTKPLEVIKSDIVEEKHSNKSFDFGDQKPYQKFLLYGFANHIKNFWLYGHIKKKQYNFKNHITL